MKTLPKIQADIAVPFVPSIRQYAARIERNWKSVSIDAQPYLDAMHSLEGVDDKYINDSGRSIISYFLCNASSWRGDVARTIKKELRNLIK